MKIFISGPSASVTIEVVNTKNVIKGSEVSATVENIIEKFCRLTGDDEYEYTANIIE